MVFSLRSKDAGGPSSGKAFPRGAVLSHFPALAVLEDKSETAKKSLLAVLNFPTLMAVVVVLDAMALH